MLLLLLLFQCPFERHPAILNYLLTNPVLADNGKQPIQLPPYHVLAVAFIFTNSKFNLASIMLVYSVICQNFHCTIDEELSNVNFAWSCIKFNKLG